MRRLSILLLSSLTAVALYACGGAPAPASTSSSIDTCPLVSAGPPAVCPAACEWDGKECRKLNSIIVEDARDSGAPPPTR